MVSRSLGDVSAVLSWVTFEGRTDVELLLAAAAAVPAPPCVCEFLSHLATFYSFSPLTCVCPFCVFSARHSHLFVRLKIKTLPLMASLRPLRSAECN